MIEASASSDPKVSIIATVLLKLQQSVLQQFQLAYCSEQEDLKGADCPTGKIQSTLPPIPPIEFKSINNFLSHNANNLLSQSVTPPPPISPTSPAATLTTPPPSTSTLQVVMMNTESSIAPVISNSFRLPNQKNHLPSDELEASIRSLQGSELFPRTVPREMQQRTLLGELPSELVVEAPPSQVISESLSITERLLENIRFKISKAKWSRDLQEFTSDYALLPNLFDEIKIRMNDAARSIGKRWMRFLASSPRRPCWAIVESPFSPIP